MKKRIVSMILALVLCVTVFPFGVFAEEEEEVPFGFMVQLEADLCKEKNPTKANEINELCKAAHEALDNQFNPIIRNGMEDVVAEMFRVAGDNPEHISDFSEMLAMLAENFDLYSNPLIDRSICEGAVTAIRIMGDFPNAFSSLKKLYEAYLSPETWGDNPLVCSAYFTANANIFRLGAAVPSATDDLCTFLKEFHYYGGGNPIIKVGMADYYGEFINMLARNPKFKDEYLNILNLIEKFCITDEGNNPLITWSCKRRILSQIFEEMERHPDSASAIFKVASSFITWSSEAEWYKSPAVEEPLDVVVSGPIISAAVKYPDLADDIAKIYERLSCDTLIQLYVALKDNDSLETFRAARAEIMGLDDAENNYSLDSHFRDLALLNISEQPQYASVFVSVCKAIAAEQKKMGLSTGKYTTAAIILLEKVASSPSAFNTEDTVSEYLGVIDALGKRTYTVTGDDDISKATASALKYDAENNGGNEYLSILSAHYKAYHIYKSDRFSDITDLISKRYTDIISLGQPDINGPLERFGYIWLTLPVLFPNNKTEMVKMLASEYKMCGDLVSKYDYMEQYIWVNVYQYIAQIDAHPDDADKFMQMADDSIALLMDNLEICSDYVHFGMRGSPLLSEIIRLSEAYIYPSELISLGFFDNEAMQNYGKLNATEQVMALYESLLAGDEEFDFEDGFLMTLFDFGGNTAHLLTYGGSLSDKFISGIMAADTAYKTQESRILKKLELPYEEYVAKDMFTSELRTVYNSIVYREIMENEDASGALGLAGALLMNYVGKKVDDIKYSGSSEDLNEVLASAIAGYKKIARALENNPIASKPVEIYIANLLNGYMSNSDNCDGTAFTNAKKLYECKSDTALGLVFCERSLSDNGDYQPYTGFMDEVDNIVEIIKNYCTFITLEGYQVRTEGYNGLRSFFKVDESKFPTIEKDGYELLEYGTLYAASEKLEKNGDKLVIDGTTFECEDYMKQLVIYRAGEVEREHSDFVCAVINFNADTYARNISSRAYAILKNAQGDKFVIYFDYAKEEYRSVSLEQITNALFEARQIDETCISYSDIVKFKKEKSEDHEVKAEEVI